MRVLILSPHYYPEHFKITDIAEYLAHNHDVTVWTNIPNYPQGKMYSGYGFVKKRKEIINGVKIQRIFTIPRKKNVIFRILNYMSFYVFSNIKAFLNRDKYDLVFNYQLSPIMSVSAGHKVAKRQKIPTVTYVLDLWPDSLLASPKIKKQSAIYKFMKAYSKRVYSRSDLTIITSEMFREYLMNLGVQNIYYVPNHSESVFENQDRDVTDNSIDYAKDKSRVLFAGNIGHAQNLDSLVKIASELKKRKKYDFQFMIVGDGVYKEKLQEHIQDKGLESFFKFYGRQPIEAMPGFYKVADILFYSLIDNEVLRKTLPGKVAGYMAFKKPIFAICSGESKRVLNKYGLAKIVASNSEATDALVEFVKDLEHDRMKINDEYFENTFKREVVLSKIERLLKKARDDYVQE